ncbi:MAG: hypothetical protein C6Y22_08885 [Hapalosiphonaceae cyanobacterium JJU2]|nr:MAG: hypothetical protein C6Y22_08885 [Hapalosiphonaceae cyanobacterium JJU2]
MTIQTITSYRFIPGKESSVTTYGSPDEQTVAIHNSIGTTVSLTFTIENMLVLQELIRDLRKIYRNFINTKKEYIEEEFSYELDEI